MKQRLGIILIITGMILLMDPAFEPDLILFFINNSLIQYWPICLVIIGIMLINKKQVRHKKKY